MKLTIMTDVEGVAGVLNFKDWCVPGALFYEKAQRLLTEEVNAAVHGFFQGGAEEITVIDGHGHGAIDPERLDERVFLMRGRDKKVHPWGLDRSVNALAYVGQHAKAGAPYSHLTHTGNFGMIDISVNGVSVGEYGQLALCAMELGIPTILACGEQAFADEAEALTPGIITVAGKRGLLPDGLDDLDREAYSKAKLSAVHRSPKRVRAMIREAALTAIRKLKQNPEAFGYPNIAPPYVRTTRVRHSGDRPPYSTRDEHPNSIIDLLNMPYTKVDE